MLANSHSPTPVPLTGHQDVYGFLHNLFACGKSLSAFIIKEKLYDFKLYNLDSYKLLCWR